MKNYLDHQIKSMESHYILNLELSLRPWTTVLVNNTVLPESELVPEPLTPPPPPSHLLQLQQPQQFLLSMDPLSQTQVQMQFPQPFTFSDYGDLPAAGPSDIKRKWNNSLSLSRVSRPKRSSRRYGSCRSSSRVLIMTIVPPYPWATDRPAVVHNLSYLKSKQIFTITGDVKCRRCERVYEIEYDLREKFHEIASYIAENKAALYDRAPTPWTNPTLPTCKFCNNENGVRPVIPETYEKINWLFMLLGKMLGCLTLDHLKYLCKYTRNHRTGAKNRLLYLAYLALCKQLDLPREPSDC